MREPSQTPAVSPPTSNWLVWAAELWHHHRLVVWMAVLALGMNAALWATRVVWFQFNPVIVWFSIGTFLVNTTLAGFLLRKQPVLAQAIVLTTLIVALLLLILVLRTGSLLV